jgi:hypothetical protein
MVALALALTLIRTLTLVHLLLLEGEYARVRRHMEGLGMSAEAISRAPRRYWRRMARYRLGLGVRVGIGIALGLRVGAGVGVGVM